MKELKRELFVTLQYLFILVFALVAAFFRVLTPSAENCEDCADAINLAYAWRNFDPYIYSVLLIFFGLSVIRFCTIFLIRSAKRKVN